MAAPCHCVPLCFCLCVSLCPSLLVSLCFCLFLPYSPVSGFLLGLCFLCLFVSAWISVFVALSLVQVSDPCHWSVSVFLSPTQVGRTFAPMKTFMEDDLQPSTVCAFLLVARFPQCLGSFAAPVRQCTRQFSRCLTLSLGSRGHQATLPSLCPGHDSVSPLRCPLVCLRVLAWLWGLSVAWPGSACFRASLGGAARHP